MRLQLSFAADMCDISFDCSHVQHNAIGSISVPVAKKVSLATGKTILPETLCVKLVNMLTVCTTCRRS